MKLSILALSIVSCVLAGASAPSSRTPPRAGPHKRALLIGVSKYARGGNPNDEWWDLSSDADVTALRALLVNKFAFAESDVVMLVSRAETTRGSILAAFETLIRSTGPGDVVFIHYSGHGTQVLDTSGDEFDGLDEALVPSDYVSRHDAGRSIIDDEIGVLLRRLEKRRPASVFLTFDSCFSGTQTRGGRMVVRGAAYDGPPPKPRGGARPDDPTGLDVTDAAALGYVVISATREDQLAMQTDDDSGGTLGLLTYALLQRLRDAGPQTSYRDLFEGVFDTMARRNPGQTPQIEGNLDTMLLDGTAAVPQPYIETRTDGDRLVLQAGSLHGITVDSRFALYPAGTRVFDQATPLGTGKVTAVHATTATLDVPGAVARYELARAVETAHKYGDASLRLDVGALDTLPRRGALSARLDALSGGNGLIRLVRGADWDVKVCGDPCAEELAGPARPPGGVRLVRHDGSLAAALRDSPALPDDFAAAIEGEAKWRMVAGLERRDPRVDVEVRLVPVDVTLTAANEVEKAVPRGPAIPSVNGKPTLSIGDDFLVEVRNVGVLDAYVSVLDLSPNGQIEAIWPRRDAGGVQDNKVKAESPDHPEKAPWKRVPYPGPYPFKVAEPTGNEIIKVIATDVPADFTPLLTPPQRGPASSGEAAALRTPVGRLLASVTRPSTRGGDLTGDPPDPTAWAARSYTFIITGRSPK